MQTVPFPSRGPRWAPRDLRGTPSGATYLHGEMLALPPTGELDLGYTSVTLPGTGSAPFVSRFDPSGNHQWTRAFVGSDAGNGPTSIEGFAVAPAGEDLVVAVLTNCKSRRSPSAEKRST